MFTPDVPLTFMTLAPTVRARNGKDAAACASGIALAVPPVAVSHTTSARHSSHVSVSHHGHFSFKRHAVAHSSHVFAYVYANCTFSSSCVRPSAGIHASFSVRKRTCLTAAMSSAVTNTLSASRGPKTCCISHACFSGASHGASASYSARSDPPSGTISSCREYSSSDNPASA